VLVAALALVMAQGTRAAPPGWAEGGDTRDARDQVRADQRHAAADCGTNSALLFRVRGSGEPYGRDLLGRWAFDLGNDLIAKGWRVRDMQAVYSAPKVPLAQVAQEVFSRRRAWPVALARLAVALKGYRDVATRESADVVLQLERAHRRCRQRVIFVAGYSQGNIVLRRALPALSRAARSKVASVDLVADPTADQRVDWILNHAPGGPPLFARQTGRGLDTAANSLRPFRQTRYSSWGKKITQYCVPYDLVCEVNAANVGAVGAILAIHRSYDVGSIGERAATVVQSHDGPVSGPPPDPGDPTEHPVEPPEQRTPRALVSEQQGSRGVNTFGNPFNASGLGPRIEPAQWVEVSCRVFAPQIVSSNPDGWWYRIASPPWNDGYYSPANTFMNGDPWGGPYTHNTDWAVPEC